jgi:hypothetical protein
MKAGAIRLQMTWLDMLSPTTPHDPGETAPYAELGIFEIRKFA